MGGHVQLASIRAPRSNPVMDTTQLISAAASGRLFGDVGAAVLSQDGRVFLGVCVDTPSWGLCAERNALAAMITAGKYSFRQAVAVWRDPETALLHILPPCDVCREFMKAIDPANLHAEIVLQQNRIVPLRVLFPEHEWPQTAVEGFSCSG